MTCRNNVVVRNTHIFPKKSLGATCKFCTPKGWHVGSSITILGARIQNVSFFIILGLYWKIVFDGRVFNVKNKYCENNNVFLVISTDRRRIRQRSAAHCSAGSQDVQSVIARWQEAAGGKWRRWKGRPDIFHLTFIQLLCCVLYFTWAIAKHFLVIVQGNAVFKWGKSPIIVTSILVFLICYTVRPVKQIDGFPLKLNWTALH